MEEIRLSRLERRLREHVEKANTAIARGHLAYAIDLCCGVLNKHPECLDARRVMGRAQRQLLAATSSRLSVVPKWVKSAGLLLKSRRSIEADPLGAISAADRALARDPGNIGAWRLLARAAEAINLIETMVFALEFIRDRRPEDKPNLLALGNGYMQLGRMDDVVRAGEAVLVIEATNTEAQLLIRNASVSQSIEKGAWDFVGDHRSKQTDAEEAGEASD